MRHASRPSSKLRGRLCVVALAFWLGGAGCALCCSGVEASAAAPGARDASAERAASAPPSCHAAALSPSETSSGVRDVDSSREASPDEHAGACCSRARLKSDPARNPRPTEGRDAARPRRETPEAGDFASAAGLSEARSRSPDNRATHLRCQVFLI
ncbi:MAG TPA: hypothetical protein VE360_01520 [Pyrinomonadaceae bacterium]|nr:hypothetical protein [Pyrinomonadaceae bacterium]